MVEVGVEGEHLAVGVVGREADLDGLVARGGLRGEVLNVAAEGALVAVGDVEAEVHVVAHLVLRWGGAVAGTEEFEADYLIACAHDDVVGSGLDELDSRHGEVHVAALLVLEFGGEVAGRGDIDADEGRELLADGDGTDVEHGAGDGAAADDVVDEAEFADARAEERTVGAERADAIDALVGVVDVDALEVLLEEGEFAEAKKTSHTSGSPFIFMNGY